MNYANNPAIVDEAFVRRVKLFVEAFFVCIMCCDDTCESLTVGNGQGIEFRTVDKGLTVVW